GPAGGGGAARPAAPPPAVEKEAPAARKDLHGDPLPPGAVARLGTARQRAAGSHLAVTADGREVVAVGPDMIVRRFDPQTGELRSARRLSGANPYRFPIRLSPRGTFVLAVGPGKTVPYQLELWDL